MREVEQLATEFRHAIEKARKAGEQDDNNFLTDFLKDVVEKLAIYWHNIYGIIRFV